VAELWVWDPPAAGVQPPPPASAPRGDAGTMTLRKVTYTPALYKIFDEVLVNACDARARDPTCDRLDVDVDLARGTVSVKNGGRGVPVEMHATEGCWVPELIFGHLLTSSNYDDAERKTTGGRNGYGAKLCNVFSTEFTVETADGAGSGRRYRQTWRRNMTDKGEATVEPCPKTENWTRVTFAPDLVRLGMPNGLDADAAALFARRAIDAAGCVGAPLTARGRRLRVFLGGREVGVRSFGDYAALYLGPPPPEDAKADPKRRNAAKTGRKGRDAASSSEGTKTTRPRRPTPTTAAPPRRTPPLPAAPGPISARAIAGRSSLPRPRTASFSTCPSSTASPRPAAARTSPTLPTSS